MRTHIVKGEEFFIGNGLDDIAFADAVTATNLGSIRNHGNTVFITMAGVAEVRLAEQDLVAEVSDVSTVTHEIEIPGAINGVTVHDRALNLVVFDHKLSVDTIGGILKDQLLAVFIPGKIAGREKIDAGDLELG